MQINRGMLLMALGALTLLAWRVQSCRDAPVSSSAEQGVERAAPCFTATSNLPGNHTAMRQVFAAANREANGEAWYAVLRAELNACSNVLGPIPAEELTAGATTGEHYRVRYRALRTWIAFDAEADGVRVCAGEPSLLEHMRKTYEHATKDPTFLRKLIAAVPAGAWDD